MSRSKLTPPAGEMGLVLNKGDLPQRHKEARMIILFSRLLKYIRQNCNLEDEGVNKLVDRMFYTSG